MLKRKIITTFLIQHVLVFYIFQIKGNLVVFVRVCLISTCNVKINEKRVFTYYVYSNDKIIKC